MVSTLRGFGGFARTLFADDLGGLPPGRTAIWPGTNTKPLATTACKYGDGGAIWDVDVVDREHNFPFGNRASLTTRTRPGSVQISSPYRDDRERERSVGVGCARRVGRSIVGESASNR
jgi:hypothetical protein